MNKIGAWGYFFKKGKNGKSIGRVKGSGYYLGVYQDRFIFSYGEGLPFYFPHRINTVADVDANPNRNRQRIAPEHAKQLRARAIANFMRWVMKQQLSG
jgi:hypothetical protein